MLKSWEHPKCCACQKILTAEGLRFPKSPALREQWVDVIMASTPNYPNKTTILQQTGLQLCVDHFSHDSILKKVLPNQTVTYGLRKGGIPSIFPKFTSRAKKTNPPVYTSTSAEAGSSTSTNISPTKIVGQATTTSPGTSSHITAETSPAGSTKATEDDEDILICYVKNASKVEQQSPVTSRAGSPAGEINDAVDFEEVPSSSSLQDVTSKNANDRIDSLEDFKTVFQIKKDDYFDPWKIVHSEKQVLFCIFDTDCKQLIQSFTLDENLLVKVYSHGQPLVNTDLVNLLGEELCLNTWTKFKDLVLFLHQNLQSKDNLDFKLKQALKLLDECIKDGPKYKFDRKVTKKWKFSAKQIELSQVNPEQRTYPKETLEWALNIYCSNTEGYKKLYDSEVLCLPHPAALELYRIGLPNVISQKSKVMQRPKAVSKRPVQAVEPTANSSVKKQKNDVPHNGLQQNRDLTAVYVNGLPENHTTSGTDFVEVLVE